jgi:hypothetical protein
MAVERPSVMILTDPGGRPDAMVRVYMVHKLAPTSHGTPIAAGRQDILILAMFYLGLAAQLFCTKTATLMTRVSSLRVCHR